MLYCISLNKPLLRINACLIYMLGLECIINASPQTNTGWVWGVVTALALYAKVINNTHRGEGGEYYMWGTLSRVLCQLQMHSYLSHMLANLTLWWKWALYHSHLWAWAKLVPWTLLGEFSRHAHGDPLYRTLKKISIFFCRRWQMDKTNCFTRAQSSYL